MIKSQGNVQQALKKAKSQKNVWSFLNDRVSNADIVYSAKNNIATKNEVTNASSLILDGFFPGYDATIIQKLNASGASMIGKTHLDELAMGGTGTHSAYGLITNPWDSSRIIGGSSSGAAASLVPGVTAAIGSDTGDSIRNPASYVGKVGFKPSYGAVSRYGLYAYATSLDTIGWITHNVNDAIAIADLAYGQDLQDMTSRSVAKPVQKILKPKRIAIFPNIIRLYDEKYQELFAQLVASLKKENIEIVSKHFDPQLLKTIDSVYSIISFSEASSNLANLNGIAFGQRKDGHDWNEIMTNTRSQGFGPMLQRRMTLGAYFLAIENQKDLFERAQKIRRLLVNEFEKHKKDVDCILNIAAPIAPKINQPRSNVLQEGYLILSNLAGTPSVVLPFGKVDNMPFGLVVDSKVDTDQKLLSHALFIENILGVNHE